MPHVDRSLMREFIWTRPETVARIRFVEWSAEGWLRHAASLGLRSQDCRVGASGTLSL